MCDKATLENDGSVKTVHGCYKSQKIRNKAGNNYYHTLKFVSESFMTQKMCDKAFDNYPSTKNMFLNTIRLTKFLKQFIDVSLYLILFLINIKPEKYAT